MIARAVTAAMFALAIAACGGSDRDDDLGECIPYEPMPGYVTCLSTVPLTGVAAPHAQALARIDATVAAARSAEEQTTLENCLPIHSQGGCGWCVLHSSELSLEAQSCLAGDSPLASVSPGHHAWEALGHPTFTFDQCATAFDHTVAFDTLRDGIYAPASVWPGSSQADMNRNVAELNASLAQPGFIDRLGCERRWSARSWEPVESNDIAALKAALDAGNFPLIGVRTYHGVGWSAGDATFGRIDEPLLPPPGDCRCRCNPNEQDCTACSPEHPFCFDGYHAVTIVGYDDAAQQFRFANSWGRGFGDRGFGTLTYAVVAASDAGPGGYAVGVEDLSPGCDDPPPPPPPPGECTGRFSGAVNTSITACKAAASFVDGQSVFVLDNIGIDGPFQFAGSFSWGGAPEERTYILSEVIGGISLTDGTLTVWNAGRGEDSTTGDATFTFTEVVHLGPGPIGIDTYELHGTLNATMVSGTGSEVGLALEF